MPYEKNKSVYQDDELFAREQRNILEVNEMDQPIIFGKQVFLSSKQSFISLYELSNSILRKSFQLQLNWVVESMKLEVLIR